MIDLRDVVDALKYENYPNLKYIGSHGNIHCVTNGQLNVYIHKKYLQQDRWDCVKSALDRLKGNMDTVLEEIYNEHNYQLSKWGTAFDNDNTMHDWVAFITKYASRNTGGSLGRLATQEDWDKFRIDMVKVATLAISAIETIDRKREVV